MQQQLPSIRSLVGFEPRRHEMWWLNVNQAGFHYKQ